MFFIVNSILDKVIKRQGKFIKYVKEIVSVSLSVQIVIVPIMICNYNTISLTFFIANILTSFLISLIIILGFALSVLSIIFLNVAKICGFFYKFLIWILIIITEFTSKIPLSKVYVKTPYLFQIISYYIFIFRSAVI